MDLYAVKDEHGKVVASGFSEKKAAKAERDSRCKTVTDDETGKITRIPNITVTYGKDHWKYRK